MSSVLPEAQVTRLLGQGAHGQVFQATWRGQIVAIKVVIHEASEGGWTAHHSGASGNKASQLERDHRNGSTLASAEASQQLEPSGISHPLQQHSRNLNPIKSVLPLDESKVRLFEGMVGLSSQHPNIVKTLKIAVQPPSRGAAGGGNDLLLTLSHGNDQGLLWEQGPGSHATSGSMASGSSVITGGGVRSMNRSSSRGTHPPHSLQRSVAGGGSVTGSVPQSSTSSSTPGSNMHPAAGILLLAAALLTLL